MEYQHINQFMAAQQLRSAGSNVAFAAVAEISDSVLKGAEANGFNGLVQNYHLIFLNLVTFILASYGFIVCLIFALLTNLIFKVSGFHQGILKLAMEPSVLGTALMEGGPDRTILLDQSPGVDEVQHFMFLLLWYIKIHLNHVENLCNSQRFYV